MDVPNNLTRYLIYKDKNHQSMKMDYNRKRGCLNIINLTKGSST